MTTATASWPRDFAGAHSTETADNSLPCPACSASARADDHQPRCDICAGLGRVPAAAPARQPSGMDQERLHDGIIAALDFTLDMHQADTDRGLISMTDYRIGTIAGIRIAARRMGLSVGGLADVFGWSEDIVYHWHEAAKRILESRS